MCRYHGNWSKKRAGTGGDPLSLWYGHPSVLGIPIPKTLVTLTQTLIQIDEVIWAGDAYITGVLGMGMPISLQHPQYSFVPRTFPSENWKNPGERLPPLPFAQITRLIFFWPCFREVPTTWGLEQAKPELTCNFFSAGQRLALLEEKLVLAHVLRHFEIQSTQSYDELQLCSELILRPKEGVFVTLTERQ